MKSLAVASVILASFFVTDAAMAQIGGRFKKLDSNNDGYLVESEIKALRLAIFDKADKDGDGALTQAEAQEARRRAPEDGRDGFAMADRDGDGKILRSDVDAAPVLLITAADSDGDQRLSRKELRDYAVKMRKAR